jgi:hypothetical protein
MGAEELASKQVISRNWSSLGNKNREIKSDPISLKLFQTEKLKHCSLALVLIFSSV